MSVNAMNPGYEDHIEFRDAEKNFHGNRLVYLHWEKHLSFCSPIAFPLPLTMPFGAFVDAIVKPHYGSHPDFAQIDWAAVEWTIDDAAATPDFAQSLAENGLHHKSLVRFRTPGLDGYLGSAS